ncbi:hypothetical protein [uncultured Azohydromonas sp.]|jgi:hypothetical protein|uniref:hypothetical protein n=1 Tax=uncultured Azohydromonas sp. TaxID=487342 RepID=UPI00261711CC|nr:hypothetical protein [uncultured Azohydromonas sp.]
MKPLALPLAAAVSALLALGVATAASSGVSDGGWPYLEGGTAPQDEWLLLAHQRQYSLLLMTAGRRGGTDLNGVRVRIVGPGADEGFDRVLAGAWLLIDLPPGRYEVTATHQRDPQHQHLEMAAGEHQAMVFYFGEVGPAPAD